MAAMCISMRRMICQNKLQYDNTREQAIETAIANVPADSKEYARNILNKLYNKIFVEKLIRYTEIQDMKQDDALICCAMSLLKGQRKTEML